DLPNFAINLNSLNIPENKPLADCEFYKPGPVDILLGGDVFWELLQPGEIHCGKQKPTTLKNTVFGWIIAGPVGNIQQQRSLCNLSLNNQELHTVIAKLWELEECSVLKPLSAEEIQFEQIFLNTTAITPEGRFCVQMPLKREPEYLADEYAESKPEISRIIKQDFYVDDLLTGADTIEQAKNICYEVSSILKTGGFELRKYYSNSSDVTKDMKTDQDCGVLELGPNEKAKTLGLMWACHTDCLTYNIENDLVIQSQRATKRVVLSIISKIFDPLGLLSPCTIVAKIIMQRLWLAQISWDDPLPDSLVNAWTRFQGELPLLNKLNLKRQALVKNVKDIELHGFADASSQAYGACVFLRSKNAEGGVQVILLCAKSKVASIKKITIPKLELCAALLLARIVEKVIASMNLKYQKVVLWPDSIIVLAWLKTSPNVLKVFVANRISEIQTLTKEYEWRHISTYDNPADIVSRGLHPSEILNCGLWCKGPDWLKLENWPTQNNIEISILPELKTQSLASAKRELSKFVNTNSDQITSDCTKEGIHWQFIPPYSSHFGCLLV
ncbi:uncharacterized protein LOC108916207, partial [Anoplophora glabripennis]|uniref:uncharacterized protein LOC108916207 n=1 Tax=Anoplophora glabripennis TaxID=217634 RepID=UPI0008759710